MNASKAETNCLKNRSRNQKLPAVSEIPRTMFQDHFRASLKVFPRLFEESISKLDLRSEGRTKILDSVRFRAVSGRISDP